jgi:hypothetical protein
MKPVIDKAEVSIEFPEKAYIGSFGRDAEFDVRSEDDGVVLKLLRRGDDRREVSVHVHYYLLADVIATMAEVFAKGPEIDDSHREPLSDAANALAAALRSRPAPKRDRDASVRVPRPGGHTRRKGRDADPADGKSTPPRR